MFGHSYFGASYFGQAFFGGIGAPSEIEAIADIRAGLRTYLLAASQISAIVGTRCFPTVLPQKVRETSIVYTRISGVGDHHTEGASGLNRIRMQVDAWAGTADAADTLARLIKGRIDGFQGLMGSVQVQGCFYDTQRDDYDDEAKMFRVSQDFMIWFEER